MKGILDNLIIEGIPEISHIKEWAELSEKLDIAFEYNDFFMPECINNHEEYKRRLDIYKQLSRKPGRDTLHGVFLDIAVNSGDQKIRELCWRRCEESVITALELNCRGVVFHTNYIVGFKSQKYQKDWVEKCAVFYHWISEKYPDMNIWVENMFDDSPELLKRLAEKCEDIKNFGVCFDMAHAAVWSLPMKEWTDALGKHTKHLHINDNNLREDLHQPLGDGNIDYSFLKNVSFPAAQSLLIEVPGIEGFKKSYEYLKYIL